MTREETQTLLDHIGRGNRKIPATTCTFNPGGCAHECPSARLGLCLIPCSDSGRPHCYAYADEERYPDTLAFRRRQGRLWLHIMPDEFTAAVALMRRRARTPIEAFRFAVASDVRNPADVRKLDDTGHGLRDIGVTPYVYTARFDLADALADVRGVCVNGSGRRFAGITHNTFTAVHPDDIRPSDTVCPGDCRGCDLCLVPRGLSIVTPVRMR